MMLRLAPLGTTNVAATATTTAGACAKVFTTAAAIRWRNIALHPRMGLSIQLQMFTVHFLMSNQYHIFHEFQHKSANQMDSNKTLNTKSYFLFFSNCYALHTRENHFSSTLIIFTGSEKAASHTHTHKCILIQLENAKQKHHLCAQYFTTNFESMRLAFHPTHKNITQSFRSRTQTSIPKN